MYLLILSFSFFRRGFHWTTSTSGENIFKLYHLKYFIEFVYFIETIQPKTYIFHASSMQMTSSTKIRVFDGGCLMTKTDRQQRLIDGWNGATSADWLMAETDHQRRLVDGWNGLPAEADWWLKRTTSGGCLMAETDPPAEAGWWLKRSHQRRLIDIVFSPLPSI